MKRIFVALCLLLIVGGAFSEDLATGYHWNVWSNEMKIGFINGYIEETKNVLSAVAWAEYIHMKTKSDKLKLFVRIREIAEVAEDPMAIAIKLNRFYSNSNKEFLALFAAIELVSKDLKDEK